MKPWLMEIISKQLAILLSLSLRNAPDPVTVKTYTIEAWYLSFEACGQFYSQERDAERLLKAFKRLLPTLKFWPAPSDILDLLPKIEESLQLEHDKPLTSDERKAGKALWSALYAVIDGKISTEEAIKRWENQEAK